MLRLSIDQTPNEQGVIRVSNQVPSAADAALPFINNLILLVNEGEVEAYVGYKVNF